VFKIFAYDALVVAKFPPVVSELEEEENYAQKYQREPNNSAYSGS